MGGWIFNNRLKLSSMNKRTFLKNATALGIGSMVSFKALSKMVDAVSHVPAEVVAEDDDFWRRLRGGYKLKPDYINLENGYYCIMPQVTEQAYLRHILDVNLQGAYYMRTVQFDNKAIAAQKVAEIAGVRPEELVITRDIAELRMQVGNTPIATESPF